MEENFIKASREQYRFDSTSGQLSIEQLWGLPLTSKTNRANLDDVARTIHGEIKGMADDVSFVTPSTTPKRKAELEAKLEIVKYIISVRVAENEAEKTRQARAEQRQKILAAIDAAENKELSSKSVEELRALLAE